MFASKDGLAGARHGELACRPRVRVRAAFKEEAPELAVRAALEKVKAAFVHVPSVAGFYLVDVPIDGHGIRSADGAVRALRGCARSSGAWTSRHSNAGQREVDTGPRATIRVCAAIEGRR